MDKEQKSIPISIGMPKELARVLRVLAAREDKSRSQFVRERLQEFIMKENDLNKRYTTSDELAK